MQFSHMTSLTSDHNRQPKTETGHTHTLRTPHTLKLYPDECIMEMLPHLGRYIPIVLYIISIHLQYTLNI